MKTLNSYFLEMGLFEEQALIDHCERHLVRIHQSPKFPHLRLLHYNEQAVYEKQWSEFCKACRGVVVDLNNKKLLTTPFFKFWNLTEAPGPSYAECQAFGEFTASEKLDGSMILVFWDQESSQVHATTKGSFDSEQGVWATQWARANLPNELQAAPTLTNYTLMFEMVQYSNKIVVDYAQRGYKEGLYLIGVRHNQSEKLFNYEEVQEFAKQYGLMTMQTYSFPSLDAVVEHTKGLPWSEEGYVLRFNTNGIMVKVKGSEYLRVHRFISNLEDKNLLECLIAGQEKEILSSCPEEYRHEVISACENYRKAALELQSEVYTLFAQAPKETRKDFALWVKSHVDSDKQKYLFTLMDQKPLELVTFYQSFLKVRKASVGPMKIQVPSLVVFVGTSGSGKSTLSHRLFPSESVVSSDKCREELVWKGQVPEEISTSDYWLKMQSASYAAFRMFHGKLDTLLGQGKVAVADSTGLNPKARAELEAIAQRQGVPVTYIVSCVPENLCVQRDATRPFPVGAVVIAKQMSQMTKVMNDLSGQSNVLFVTPKNCDQLSVTLVQSNGDLVKPEEQKMNNEPIKKDTVLCDLDGTLADLKHRLHYVKNRPANWDAFFKECVNDTPNLWCVELLRAMKTQGYNVIVVSARSRVVLKESREWMNKAGLSDIELVLVRPERDSTPDQILKKQWLDAYGKERVLFVVDDRQKVVDAWRAEGLVCLQCDVWSERAK